MRLDLEFWPVQGGVWQQRGLISVGPPDLTSTVDGGREAAAEVSAWATALGQAEAALKRVLAANLSRHLDAIFNHVTSEAVFNVRKLACDGCRKVALLRFLWLWTTGRTFPARRRRRRPPATNSTKPPCTTFSPASTGLSRVQRRRRWRSAASVY